jgi:MFS family permease
MAICMSAFVSHFTAGVVNVSLPYLSEIFHTNLIVIQWITIGYLLAIASFLPVMGYLGDRLGHRLIHNLGYILFTISSVLRCFRQRISP